jgi:hypothetical protein
MSNDECRTLSAEIRSTKFETITECSKKKEQELFVLIISQFGDSNLFWISIFGFRIYPLGTGSRVPTGTQGMQRNNREVVSQRPFGKPCTSIASSE